MAGKPSLHEDDHDWFLGILGVQRLWFPIANVVLLQGKLGNFETFLNPIYHTFASATHCEIEERFDVFVYLTAIRNLKYLLGQSTLVRLNNLEAVRIQLSRVLRLRNTWRRAASSVLSRRSKVKRRSDSFLFCTCVDVSKNGGTQQPWVFLLKIIILGCFGGTPILETPMCPYLI